MIESRPYRWFIRLWSVAIIAHVVGNPRVEQLWPNTTALGVTTFILGLLAVGTLIHPANRALIVGIGLGVPVVAWFEAPFIGNHWIAASVVSLALLFSLTRSNPWGWFAPTGRWILLGFYGWAAFNKLNAGFFDPDVSCGAVYTNQWLESAGLPTIAYGGMVAFTSALVTALIELAVPVLLVMRRTRRWGVLLGFAFHGLISLDLGQHFYDFTSLLLAMFGLFLADEITGGLEDRFGGPSRLRTLTAGFPLILVFASVAPLSDATVLLLTRGVFFVWIPYLVFVLVVTYRASAQPTTAPATLRLAHPVGIALAALVILNGFTPYLELKTGYGWNMYANLVTTNGESNHFVIRGTLPLTDVQESLAVVVSTDDADLELYVGSEYAVPERRLLHYLSEHPESSVEYRVGSRTVSGTGADLGEPLPVLVEKFQLFRSVDLERPVRCQLTWLPAR